MRVLLASSLTLLVSLVGCKPKPKGPQTYQAKGFSVQYEAEQFSSFKAQVEPKLTAQEIGDSLPDGEGPERIVIKFDSPVPSFTKKVKGARQGGSGEIVFLPLQDSSVPDFNAAYPILAKDSETVTQFIKNRPKHPHLEFGLPDYWLMDVAHGIEARYEYLDSDWLSGFMFLTRYEQDFNPIDNEYLEAVFQGITKDGKYYVAAKFSIAHPSLPAVATQPDKEPSKDELDRYHHQIEESLGKADPKTFFPSMGALKKLIRSIRPTK